MSSPLSRLGFHYFPDDSHYTGRDLEQWLPVLLKLAARWLVLSASPKRSIPEPFVRGIVEAGIRPVVWIKSGISDTSPRELAPLLTSYSAWGVQEVVVFDRPNQRTSWTATDWSRPDLVERFVDRMLPILQLEKSVGLIPVFPPLEPGGDYWDTAFLETALQSIQRRGQSSLLRKMCLAIYGWTFGHPLDWGYGGPANWPEARPYEALEGIQDQIGFRTFDWYGLITKSQIGVELPMIVVAGGPGDAEAARARPAQAVSEILRALQASEVTDSVLAFNFYLLACDPDSQAYSNAWFAAPGEPKPLVAAAKRMIDASGKQVALQVDKPLNHYVLLPHAGLSDDSWMAARQLAQDAVVGFSTDEAAQAKRVTLVGDEAAIPPSVERRLTREGCLVLRVGSSSTPSWDSAQRRRS